MTSQEILAQYFRGNHLLKKPSIWPWNNFLLFNVKKIIILFIYLVCKYSRGDWSNCDPTTNQKTRTLTLRKGDPNSCEKEKIITKSCKRGKYLISIFCLSFFLLTRLFYVILLWSYCMLFLLKISI